MNERMNDHGSNEQTLNPVTELLVADIKRFGEQERALETEETELQRRMLAMPEFIKQEQAKVRQLLAAIERVETKLKHWMLEPRYDMPARFRRQRKALKAELVNLHSTLDATSARIVYVEKERDKAEPYYRKVQERLRDMRITKCRLFGVAKLTAGERRQSNGLSMKGSVPHPKSVRKELTAGDIMNTHYETFHLGTDLGRFLGDLERNKLAIALTGDSGAGKSHFAFELTRLFSDETYSTKVFCLEEGTGNLTRQKIEKYGIGPEVAFAGAGTLADVRRDAATFEVIVVDSFTKLNVDSTEFERLRTDFPQTIFILIFQKATSGGMRGGSSILFNSSATIDVTKDGGTRYATMVKSRYGTIGWRYDIDAGRTIAAD